MEVLDRIPQRRKPFLNCRCDQQKSAKHDDKNENGIDEMQSFQPVVKIKISF